MDKKPRKRGRGRPRNPDGRPPSRPFGRVDDIVWKYIKGAAELRKQSFTAWATEILVAEAKLVYAEQNAMLDEKLKEITDQSDK